MMATLSSFLFPKSAHVSQIILILKDRHKNLKIGHQKDLVNPASDDFYYSSIFVGQMQQELKIIYSLSSTVSK